MATRDFPALGFDPAPGDPVAVADAGRTAHALGNHLADLSEQLGVLRAGGWTGPAGDAFRQEQGKLPPDLNVAARAQHVAGRALIRYGEQLQGLQRRAVDLEHRAAALDPADIGALNSVRAAGHRLADDRSAAADVAASALHTADEPPYKEPGLFSKEWLREHKGLLKGISTGLKWIGGALGAAALIPGLQPLALWGVAFAGAGIGMDVLLKTTIDEGTWSGIAKEGALSLLLPFAGKAVGALRFGSRLGRALTAGDDIDPRLAVATAGGRELDVASITPRPVWRTDLGKVWVADARHPTEVFSSGLPARALGNADLARQTTPGWYSWPAAFRLGYRSLNRATGSPELRRGGWLYEVADAPGGINVNATLARAGQSPQATRQVAFPGGVHPGVIRGAYEVPYQYRLIHANEIVLPGTRGANLGAYIANPTFG